MKYYKRLKQYKASSVAISVLLFGCSSMNGGLDWNAEECSINRIFKISQVVTADGKYIIYELNNGRVIFAKIPAHKFKEGDYLLYYNKGSRLCSFD